MILEEDLIRTEKDQGIVILDTQEAEAMTLEENLIEKVEIAIEMIGIDMSQSKGSAEAEAIKVEVDHIQKENKSYIQITNKNFYK